ncbi:MAG: ABC transporter permease subunit, partial [Hyphomicrobiaceae bacterium]
MRFLSGRFLHSVLTLWLVTILFFLMIEIAPGDFAIATATRDTTSEQIQTLRYQLGLYATAPERYAKWLFGILSGDFGTSWWARKPIAPLVAERLWHSTWLVIWATIFTVPLAIVLALATVARRGGLFDRLTGVMALSAMSIPEFIIAYSLMGLLAVYFSVFPVHTMFVFEMPFWERLRASGLPILSLAAVAITPIFRLSRAALLNVLSAEYIQMAELKGLSPWQILFRHALPNAAAPIANIVVLTIANLFVGLVIIESIFSYPGLGQLILTAATLRDMPLVLVCAMVSATIYVGLNFLADAITIVSNPRLRYPSQPSAGPGMTSRIGGKIFAVRPSPPVVAGGIAVLLLAAGATAWALLNEDIEEVRITTAAAPEPGPRRKLIVAALQGDNPDLSGLVHYDYFRPFGTSAPAKHPLQGRLKVPRFKMFRRRPLGSVSVTQEAFFPDFETGLVAHGDVLLPIERDKLLKSSSGGWYIILSPGRVWHEPGDGDWSRGSFPFTMTAVQGFAPYYGVATFLFNGRDVSHLRVQIAQETANWAQFDLWGQSPVTFTPGPVPGEKQARAAHDRRAQSSLDVRPWSELAGTRWRSIESFDGVGNRENVAVSGLLIDNIFYLRPCRTRAGPHPHCRSMRYGVFSITKSLGAGIGMLRLAQKYGPEVFDLKITDYVSIPAKHDGWKTVTFGHALNMVTGIGNITPRRVTHYVEADESTVGNRVYRMKSIQEKLDAMAMFRNYPWGPGEVFRYRTSDTTALGAAMEAFLRTKEGPDADLWDFLTREVYAPLGIDRLPVRRSIEPDGRRGTPLLGAGLFITIEEALKLARLLQDHGAYEGRQLLHRELTARAMSSDMDQGYPNGWRTWEGIEGRYELSFWRTPHARWFGCDVRIPTMSGYGGNYVSIM